MTPARRVYEAVAQHERPGPGRLNIAVYSLGHDRYEIGAPAPLAGTVRKLVRRAVALHGSGRVQVTESEHSPGAIGSGWHVVIEPKTGSPSRGVPLAAAVREVTPTDGPGIALLAVAGVGLLGAVKQAWEHDRDRRERELVQRTFGPPLPLRYRRS